MVTAIYQLADLFPGRESVPGYYHDTLSAFAVETYGGDASGQYRIRGWGEINDWARDCSVHTIFDREPTAAEVRAAVYEAYKHALKYREPAWQPILAAEPVARRFKARVRLAPEQLLADPAFVAKARTAARQGKAFTADLLEWEKKDAVSAAVAVVRAEVDAERAAEERALAESRRVAAEKLERERPIREPLLVAYAHCRYRECAQGHVTQVIVGDASPGGSGQRVGCAADTRAGERYSSRVTFRKMESMHRLWVRADWAETVGARAATVDVSASECRVVLACYPRRLTPDGVSVLWELLTVKQGRGTGIETDRVWATYHNGAWYVQKSGSGRGFRELHNDVQLALAALEDDAVRAFFDFHPDTPAPVLADWLQDRDVSGPALDVLRRELLA